ncbi:uncharacterized protein LOC143296269 [Babylonia areolata]|uniref:uncharacterized protein LOC143296269 n=1 Tax=Babylonia areolata TaxID=304850 RepID=UPI003FD2B185
MVRSLGLNRAASRMLLMGMLAVPVVWLLYRYLPLARSPLPTQDLPALRAVPLAGGQAAPEIHVQERQDPVLPQQLPVLTSMTARGWSPVICDRNRQLRKVTLPSPFGQMSLYVYDSFEDDSLLSQDFLKGKYFERKEMAQFLNLSRNLPLIDLGANVGLVTMQAALQGRQVVAVEPIPGNALRLCRSVLDSGHAHLVHVAQNAVSSQEGNVTLALTEPERNPRTQYKVMEPAAQGREHTVVYSIHVDRLLDWLPFKKAALKIDVESYEGHALAGAELLFQKVDIPLVWMEWQHVKSLKDYGGPFIISFMQRHHLDPYNVMTAKALSTKDYLNWPFTVLWRKSGWTPPV